MRLSNRAKEVDLEEELLLRVGERFPTPIAEPTMLLYRELARLDTDWEKAFTRMINCFEISVTFLGLVTSASYLRNTEFRLLEADYAIERLNKKGMLTGEWWRLLRETLRAHHKASGECLSGILAERYFNAGGGFTRVATMLDKIVNLRNKKKGHAWNLKASEYKDLVKTHYPDLKEWLRTLAIVEDFWLVEILKCVERGGVYVCEADLLRGSRRFQRRIELEFDAKMKEREELNPLYIVPALEKVPQVDDSAVLSLHPLIVRERNEDGAGDVFLFEGRKSGKLEYKTCLHSGVLVLDHGDAFDELLSRVTPWIKKNPEYLEPFLTSARSKTQANLEQMKADRTYEPSLYTEREEFKKQVDEFLKSEKLGMIIGGESGIGKTNFMCALAEKVLGDENSSSICLLLCPNDFSSNDASLDRLVRSSLGIQTALKEWIHDLKDYAEKKRHSLKSTLIVLVDGIDRHPSVGSMLQAIDNWIQDVRGEWLRVKVVATSTLVGLYRAKQDGVSLHKDEYYAPLLGMGSTACDDRLPFVLLPPFNKKDLKRAYKCYKKNERYSPRTDWESLPNAARRALTHPLFLRLAMEVYNQEQIPPDPISNKILFNYCQKYIFRNRDRATKIFVDRLVDMMLERRTRKIGLGEIASDPWVREAFLATGPTAPLNRLLDEQVLLQHHVEQPDNIALLPEEYVEFSLDMVFQYLLVNRAIARLGLNAEAITLMAECAREFPSLRAGLIDLLRSLAKHDSLEHFTELLDQSVAEFRIRGVDGWVVSILSEVLVDLSDYVVGKDSGRLESVGKTRAGSTGMPPVKEFVARLFRLDAELGIALVFKSVNVLFVQGRWRGALALLRLARRTNKLSQMERFYLNNRLVVLLKNMDHWDKARFHSDENEAVVQSEGSWNAIHQKDIVRHYLNRFSVLHDQGERVEAAVLCEKAFDRAKELRLFEELAAGANNLGVARILFDEVQRAEEHLNTGVHTSSGSDLLKGHNYINRGLLRLLKAQLMGTDLVEARQDIDAAIGGFQKLNYAQGILYGHLSLGLLLMHQEDWNRSLEEFEKSEMMAKRIGERWPKYVTWANKALWFYRNPRSELAKAMSHAKDAYEGARKINDDEGIAFSGMILARILMDKGGEDLDRTYVVRLLTSAEKNMNALEYHSPAALACAGLIEFAEMHQKNGKIWRQRREHHRAHLDPAIFPACFADKFEPMDWKCWFLAEMR